MDFSIQKPIFTNIQKACESNTWYRKLTGRKIQSRKFQFDQLLCYLKKENTYGKELQNRDTRHWNYYTEK